MCSPLYHKFYSNMQVYLPDGKIEVSFYGKVYANCTGDQSCPSQATCACGYDFSPYPCMCVCQLSLATYGDRCQYLTPAAWGMVFLILVGILIAFVSMIINCLDTRLWIRAGKRWTCSASQTTVLTLFLGSLSVQCFFWIGLAEEFEVNELIIRDGRNSTSAPDWRARAAFVAASFWFVTFGLLNISVVWAEIAYTTQHMMTARISNNIRIYRRSIAAYYALFGGAVIAFTIMDRSDIITYLVIPPILFIIFSYAWGYQKMKVLMMKLIEHGKEEDSLLPKNYVIKPLKWMSLLRTSSAEDSSQSRLDGDESPKAQRGSKNRAVTSIQEETRVSSSAGNSISSPPSQPITISSGQVKILNVLRLMATCAYRVVIFGLLGVIFTAFETIPSFLNQDSPVLPLTYIFGWISWIFWASCLLSGTIYIHGTAIQSLGGSTQQPIASHTNTKS